MLTARPSTSLRRQLLSPLTPEPLEGRVLLSVVILDGTTTLGSADFNNDGADDSVIFARARRARRIPRRPPESPRRPARRCSLPTASTVR
jgi:hypothetical protein